MLKIIFEDFTRKRDSHAAGPGFGETFPSSTLSLMNVALVLLIFRTWPVISGNLGPQMCPTLIDTNLGKRILEKCTLEPFKVCL